MTWGVLSIGGVEFREETVIEESSDGSMRLSGQEAHPPRSRAHVEAAHGNLKAMAGLTVPVTFTDKAELTGFYRVDSAGSTYEKWANGAVQTASWRVDLTLIGGSSDVEIESRVPTIARLKDHATTPVFWHAPAGGSSSYYTGATVPAATISRTSADGVIRVYLGIPLAVAPRWTVKAEDYLIGAARLSFLGFRRIGKFTPPLATWEMSNGLVKIVPGPTGSVIISAWDASQWRSAKTVTFTVSGAALTDQPDITIMRNDPEEVAIRLTYPIATGRTTVDLALRRGSRFATVLMKRHSSAALGIGSTGTYGNVTGGIRESSADADGNRLVMGSARTVTQNLTSISKATTVADYFIGHEIDAAPQTGDAYLDLLAQYLGSTGERIKVVRR